MLPRIVLGCLLLVGQAASFSVAGRPSPFLGSPQRTATVEMKGKGTRGMPGKAVRPPSGSGFNEKSKSRMQKRDFEKDEWTFVAAKGDLGEGFGATKAVEAGQSPQGINYIWTLVRTGDSPEDVVATDGSCRACTSPVPAFAFEKDSDGITKAICGPCGSEFNMDDGSVIKWLPGANPVQWAAKQLNKDKEELAASIMRTRVSQSGRIYVRLPDGTLKITKSADDRAAELAAPLGVMDAVKAAQEKASSL